VWPNKDTKTAEPPKTEEKPPVAPSAEELLAKMGELLGPIKDWQEKTSTRLDAMEEARKPKEPPEEPVENVSVLDDENAAFNQRLTPLAIETINLRARMTEREVLDETMSGWQEFLPAVKAELANTQVQVKAMPNYESYVRNVVDMIVGREARKGGLKRDKSRFVLEDATSVNDNGTLNASSQEDKDFLNFHVTTGKGKVVTRGEYLKRMGIDVSNPDELKKVRESWSKVQVVQ
jgi:hypothetical protein